jgi:hypothetical protein
MVAFVDVVAGCRRKFVEGRYQRLWEGWGGQGIIGRFKMDGGVVQKGGRKRM